MNKAILLIFLSISGRFINAQDLPCKLVEDTLFLFHVEIYQDNNHETDLWLTGKYLISKNYNEESAEIFIRSLAEKNFYCPSLPEGYHSIIIICLKDSGSHYLQNNPYPFEIIRALRKSSVYKNYHFNDNSYIKIKVVKITGLFWQSDLFTSDFKIISTEYPIKKAWFKDYRIFIPFKTTVLRLKRKVIN